MGEQELEEAEAPLAGLLRCPRGDHVIFVPHAEARAAIPTVYLHLRRAKDGVECEEIDLDSPAWRRLEQPVM